MFGIDFSEILLIVLVGFLVLDAKDVPRILYAAGKIIGKVRLLILSLHNQGKALVEEQELTLYKEKAEAAVKKHDDAPQ